MLDLYASGPTLRLAQSFVPTKALRLGPVAFTYDQAVLAIALLRARDDARAGIVGQGLLYAQAHDPAGDGRVRNAYYVNPFVSTGGALHFADAGTDTGNMSWSGLALCQLYAKTRDTAYLNAAEAIGTWIYTNTRDVRGPGGYTGGLGIRWKSTEHNLDVYALFSMLARFSGSASWSANAAPALALVDSMWNARRGFYWIGTLSDGVSPNTIPIPEDVQTWSFLATGRHAYAASIDWAIANLSAANGPFSGVSFSNADRRGVWFEGTAHLAAALLLRNGSGDRQRAQRYLADLVFAQAHAPNTDSYGIDAASINGLRTGDGDAYYAALHVGATGWYVLAALASDPFVTLR